MPTTLAMSLLTTVAQKPTDWTEPSLLNTVTDTGAQASNCHQDLLR